jgi:hypothetical protein
LIYFKLGNLMDPCLIFDVLVDLIVPEPTVTPPLLDEGSSGLALVEFRQAPQRCAFKEGRSADR